MRSARSLSQLIECEIIPRLMVAHVAPVIDHPPADPADVIALADLALQVEADELLSRAESLLADGMTVEGLMVDLLGPAARTLGEYWESDRCDFVDVTMGLWRLQEVVHELGVRQPGARHLPTRRALFAPMPGDQHGFGTLVLAEVFTRGGWSVERAGDASTRSLMATAAGEWFDLVGLTVSCDCHTATLPSVISGLRGVSHNPAVRVMVGGRVFADNPALATTVGADGTANDAREALLVAAALVAPADTMIDRGTSSRG
ncbi:cobalamin B12-binding domain-containing protein [Sphingomonas sp. SUN019]|uniref:cobalamin B12-binding domain-containing protein n=1 Tax=Sphingomonas sp. SUN019 TaxID=2937788 RepID=UPI002164B319|nr:cobalamin B12-binding domain-containing protein [Sphingomonas sp. SUN019]UVO50820.1 cobalamin B12-binding domain-containing protein [Sphingomonas sp. SUN019]